MASPLEGALDTAQLLLLHGSPERHQRWLSAAATNLRMAECAAECVAECVAEECALTCVNDGRLARCSIRDQGCARPCR